MCQHMIGQDVRVCKPFEAHLALIGSFAGVRSFVLYTTAEIGETLVTIRASVRLVSGMRPHVPAQFEVDDESFAANSIFLRTQINPYLVY